jgi:hypothetical protein
VTHCTRRIRGRNGHPQECAHPAQTIYTVEGADPLCRKHDSEAAHKCAAERGYGVKVAA